MAGEKDTVVQPVETREKLRARVVALDQRGVYAASGSACTSGAIEPGRWGGAAG